MAGLTQARLDRLLQWLDPDRERAGEAYEGVRRRLVKFFEYRGCIAPDEPADEVIDRVARRIAEGEDVRASEPYAYFYGVARNVLREQWDRPESRWVPLDPLDEAGPPAPPGLPLGDEGRRGDCLLRCLDALSPRQRELVLDYYEWGRRERIGSRVRLAERLGLPMNALRLRVHRVREALERCVGACLDRRPEGSDMDPAPRATHRREEPR